MTYYRIVPYVNHLNDKKFKIEGGDFVRRVLVGFWPFRRLVTKIADESCHDAYFSCDFIVEDEINRVKTFKSVEDAKAYLKEVKNKKLEREKFIEDNPPIIVKI